MDFLRISDNKRYFVRGGAPFFWMGDTIWPAVSWYSMEELETYFKRRREQGFTLAHIMIAWTMPRMLHDGSEDGRDPKIVADEIPFWLNDNPATPNEAYFNKLDRVIELAAKYGILITILPNGGSGGSFVHSKKVITLENIRAYGRWLGRRYRDEPNIVWVNGFDLLPWMYEDLTREFNAGLLEEDGGNHLLFFHPCGSASSSHFHGEDWLAANFIQTWSDYNLIQNMVTADYHRKPAKPVVHVEGAYEAGTEYTTAPITSWHVREQAYWSYLCGGFHTYGHNDMWRKAPSWRDALDSKGAWQMKILKDFFTALDWWKLEPDPQLIKPVFRGGHAAARSADGQFAVIYYAHRSTLMIDMQRLNGGNAISGEWMDPQTGKRFGKFMPGGAACRITSPAQCDDAVLLLKAK